MEKYEIYLKGKEAIDYIKNHGVWSLAAAHGWTKPDEKLIESFNIIEKDLEILEIIKKHYVMNGFNELIPINFENNEDFNLLESWLENEKN